jgi:hypothetical protein
MLLCFCAQIIFYVPYLQPHQSHFLPINVCKQLECFYFFMKGDLKAALFSGTQKVPFLSDCMRKLLILFTPCTSKSGGIKGGWRDKYVTILISY